MWHMKSYWLTEVLVLGCYAVVFPLMYVKGSMCPVWLFYHYLGIPPGVVVSILYMAVVEAVDIVLAQRLWILRARRLDKEQEKT